MTKLSEQKKTELLEAAVLEGNVDKIRDLFSEHGEVEFTARALGIACRFCGAEMVKCLIDNHATFTYEASAARHLKTSCAYPVRILR